MLIRITLIFLLAVLPVLSAGAQEKSVLLLEDFEDLDEWKPLEFAKIKEHSEYSIAKEGDRSYLKAESSASASGIIFKKEFNVFEFPKVKWRWKVSNVYEKGNALKKSGDDYPLRVYIIFKYDPDKAPFGQRFKYGLAKSIYGEYPPHSSLTYIWANRLHDKNIMANPYADEVRMIVLQAGAENTGKWIVQEIDIIEDYRKAFAHDPPATGSLAIMNDSDNTGESAVSYLDYITVYR